MTDIGAKYTNAFTSNELTAYMNDIPSNEIKKWLILEANRLEGTALRLFHTELETVYEEFNMYQDRDESRAFETLDRALFPTHPSGRSVIGYPEHLKNPSMVNIMKFKDTWYVPNNMVICMSGDLDPEKTIIMIDETFGEFPSKELPVLPETVEQPVKEPVIKEISGPDAEILLMGYRCGGEHSSDKPYISLISSILYNGQAGLIDIDLIQEQKILDGLPFSQKLRIHSNSKIFAGFLPRSFFQNRTYDLVSGSRDYRAFYDNHMISYLVPECITNLSRYPCYAC